MIRTHYFILLTAVFYILLLFILNCFLPFSLFFNIFHETKVLYNQVEEANKLRAQNSLEYFSSIDSSLSLNHYKKRLSDEQINIAIGIITIKRSNENGLPLGHGYLFQSVSALDVMLKERAIFNNSVPFICNVDAYPTQHAEATELYSYLPFVERYGTNSLGIPDLLLPHTDRPFKDITRHMSLYQKETYDYVFCLEAAAKLDPQFILLIEEDTIPHKGFPEFLDHLVNFRLRELNASSYGFVKFYFPSKWQGFSLSLSEMCDLIGFGIVGATLFTCILSFHLVSIRFFTGYKKLFIVGFLISLFTCHMLGRQNLIEFRRLSPHLYRMKSSEDCCTQAMLYPIEVMRELPHFMISESMSTHTDLIISDFVKENELLAYQIEPNLFYHTGLHSSLPMEQKHPIEFIIP